MKRLFAPALAVVGAFVAVGTAVGAPLSLVRLPPDLASQFVVLDYDGAGNLVITGTPVSFDVNGVAPIDYPSIAGPKEFRIEALLDTTNGNVVSGNIEITGEILALGASGTLLSGTLDQFGFQAGSQDFQFTFTGIGGALAGYFGSAVGVNIDAFDSTFSGSFSTAWNNNDSFLFAGTADTFGIASVVPTPAAVSAGGGLLGMLALARRHRNRRDNDTMKS